MKTKVRRSRRQPEPKKPSHPTLLIIEDDRELREVITECVARRFPFLAIAWAGNGGEAIRLIAEHHGSGNLHMIISDIVLPGSSTGIDLWNHCQQACPRVPFLFMSGLPEDFYRQLETPAAPTEQASPRFLPKPFTSTEFKSVMDEFVDQYFHEQTSIDSG